MRNRGDRGERFSEQTGPRGQQRGGRREVGEPSYRDDQRRFDHDDDHRFAGHHGGVDEGRYETRHGQGDWGDRDRYGGGDQYARGGRGRELRDDPGSFQSPQYRYEASTRRGGQREEPYYIDQQGPQQREWAPWRGGPDWPRHQGMGESQRASGGFRGRGPRDYQRTDDRIREDVCDRLTEDDGLDASDITVRVSDGEVTLEGKVDERRAKWMAEEIACSCSGVKEVHNHLRVARPEEGQMGRGQAEGQTRGQDMQARNGGNGGAQGQRTQTGVGSTSGRS